jgi:hypothetical protein
MSLTGPWIKDLAPTVVALGSSGTLGHRGPVRCREALGACSCRELWNTSPFFFLSLFSGHEVSNLHCHVLLPWWATSSEVQSNGVTQSWTETSRTMSQNKYFLLVINYLRYFKNSNSTLAYEGYSNLIGN